MLTITISCNKYNLTNKQKLQSRSVKNSGSQIKNQYIKAFYSLKSVREHLRTYVYWSLHIIFLAFLVQLQKNQEH